MCSISRALKVTMNKLNTISKYVLFLLCTICFTEAENTKKSIPAPLLEVLLKADTVALKKEMRKKISYRTKSMKKKLLYKAMMERDSLSARYLIENGAPVNTKDSSLTQLHMAIEFHLPSIIELLVEKGANITEWADLGNHPILHFIAYENEYQEADTTGYLFYPFLVRELVKQKIPPHEGDWVKEATLAMVLVDDLEMFDYILDNVEVDKAELRELLRFSLRKSKMHRFVDRILEDFTVDKELRHRLVLEAVSNDQVSIIKRFLMDSDIVNDTLFRDSLFTKAEKQAEDIYKARPFNYLSTTYSSSYKQYRVEKMAREYEAFPLWKKFHIVVASDYMDIFKGFVEQERVILTDKSYQVSLLNKKKYEHFKVLIEMGADINVLDENYDSYLETAIDNNDISEINFALNHGINDDYFERALKHAIHKENYQILSYLLEKEKSRLQANPLILDYPFIAIVKKGNLERVKEFVNYGARINALDTGNVLSALSMSCRYDYIDISRYLLENGATLQYTKDTIQEEVSLPRGGLQNEYIDLFLNYNPGPGLLERIAGIAFYENNIDLLKRVCERGIDPLRFSDTVFFYQKTNYRIRGYKVHHIRKKGYQASLLHKALKKNNREMVDALIELGAKPFLYNSYRFRADGRGSKRRHRVTYRNLKEISLVHYAIEHGNPEMALYLFNKGYYDSYPEECFVGALLNGYTELATKLFSHIAWKVDRQGFIGGEDPLYVAVTKGYGSIVDLLIKKGISNKKYSHYLHYSLKSGQFSITKKLINNGYLPEAYNTSYLRMMVQENKYEMARYLIKQKAAVTEKNGYSPPLELAVRKDKRQMIKLLVANGAPLNPTKSTCHQHNPLAIAIINENFSLLKYLIALGGTMDRSMIIPWSIGCPLEEYLPYIKDKALKTYVMKKCGIKPKTKL